MRAPEKGLFRRRRHDLAGVRRPGHAREKTHERSTTIAAFPDDVWRIIADVPHMTEWLDIVTTTELGRDGVVRAFANAGGQEYQTVDRYTIDHHARRVSWQSLEDEHRRGSLTVHGEDVRPTTRVVMSWTELENGHDEGLREAIGFGLGYGRTTLGQAMSVNGFLDHCLADLRRYAETGHRANDRYR